MCNQLRRLFLVIFALSATDVRAQEKIFEDLGVAEFRNKLDATPKAILIDLRTAEEVQKGMIERAEMVDFYADNFEDQMGDFDREKTYFIYCASGGRSGETLEVMKKLGFIRVYNLSEGYKGWIEAKQPVILPRRR